MLENQAKIKKIAIGLMSGTSMDGIDASIIESDGQDQISIIGHCALEYDEEFSQKLKNSLKDAEKIIHREDRPANLALIEKELTLKHCDVVEQILKKYKMKPEQIDVIGFHGQTILHRPKIGLTVQLGDGKLLAEKSGINVIYDMRHNDMVHGGQGAPLVPVYHRALAKMLSNKVRYPVAFVNIGGIANLTWVDSNNRIFAFDCGPGNALLDQWIYCKIAKNFDEDGNIALKGKFIDKIFQKYQNHRFFTQNQPASLDWRDFKPLTDMSYSLEDGAATLSYITAYGIVHSLRHVPQMPKTLIISGGGAYNMAILAALKQLSADFASSVIHAQDLGLNAHFMEAEAWGYLAIRSLYKLPISFPTTTGCDVPVSGGVFVKAK